MTPKQRILAVLNRQPVDRLPVDIWHTPEVGAQLKAHFGVQDELELYAKMGLDKIVWDFMEYRNDAGEATGAQSGAGAENSGSRTLWGVPLKGIDTGGAHYMEFGEAPLTGFETPESLKDYAFWPDPDRFEYDKAVALAERASQAGFCVIGPWVSFFEIYCQMRGLEQSMIDIACEPELVDAILDRIEAIQTEMMTRFFKRAGHLLTLAFISDDIGCQTSLLISPDAWRRHLQPRMKRWCDLIHSFGIKVFYHSDGAMELMLGELIDCGIDVLNPIQHVCPGMDMAHLKKKYGDRVIFHGGVDNQSALPFGTPEVVRQETLDCLNTLGAGKEGFICCSCHNIQPGTPLENILTMVRTVRES